MFYNGESCDPLDIVRRVLFYVLCWWNFVCPTVECISTCKTLAFWTIHFIQGQLWPFRYCQKRFILCTVLMKFCLPYSRMHFNVQNVSFLNHLFYTRPGEIISAETIITFQMLLPVTEFHFNNNVPRQLHNEISLNSSLQLFCSFEKSLWNLRFSTIVMKTALDTIMRLFNLQLHLFLPVCMIMQVWFGLDTLSSIPSF
jgi:hypothetical protein